MLSWLVWLPFSISWAVFNVLAFPVALLSFVTYLLPILFQTLYSFLGPQNLKTKYNAEWALVTGGSSGIGKALCMNLLGQGINIIVAALETERGQPTLQISVDEFRKAYPDRKVRMVPVNLGKPSSGVKGGFLDALEEATKDIDVQIVFSNAGYILTGFFAERSLGANAANHHCNATSGMEITHHFLSKMLNMDKKGPKGCIVFTSSPANLMPCPFSAMYGATKAFLTEFAISIAPEVKNEGIDICVVHPSPVNSNFYADTHAIDAIAFFKSTAVGPKGIADFAMSAVGRPFGLICEQGYYPRAVRLLLKMVDMTFIATVITRCAHLLPDYQKMKDETAKRKAEVAASKSNGTESTTAVTKKML